MANTNTRRRQIGYAYFAFLVMVSALVWAGAMKVHKAHGEALPADKAYVIRGTAEAIDHSRPDQPLGIFGEPVGTPKLFKDEAECKEFTHSQRFLDATARQAIQMQTWHPPARLHQECVPLNSMKERSA